MTSRRLGATTGLLVLAAAVSGALASTPLGSGITYQGQLTQSGSPFNGSANIKFDLYDAVTAGNLIGTQTINGVVVTNGLFTVQLNGAGEFGANAFNGDNRWLQITVSGTPLAPRQPLTAAPYALFALNSPGSGLWATTGTATYNTADTFVGINRNTPVSGSDVFAVRANVGAGTFGGMYADTSDAGGWPFYGYATAGTFRAYHYYDGGTGDWKLVNGTTRMTIQSDGDVGIGTTNPGSRLEVSTSANNAITGSSSASFSIGVHGTGLSAGVQGNCSSSDGSGVYGIDGTAGGTGVRGDAGSPSGGAGLAGYSNFGTGAFGQTSDGYGVYGSSSGGNGWAGYFNGPLHVNGTLSKNGGSFKIDHPLDPANKYLSHSFVESPDMMNVYNGNVVLDEQGQATVQLPEWFEALNREFRYQLTCIGGFAPVYVAQEIQDNQFRIAGGTAGLKVSWQVTGIRHDAWADAHRIPVEEVKTGKERGKYLNPELYGQPAELQLHPPFKALPAQGAER